MDFLNNIKDDSILIIPSNIKNKILEYIDNNNLLINVKIMSFNDLKKGLLYDYTNEAIYFIMNKYQVSYSVAKEYINNTYYINEDDDNNKLHTIYEVKIDLINNNLLIYDKLFINLLKSKKNIYIYGFSYINKFNKYLINEASKYINIINIDNNYKDYKHTAIECKSIEDEIMYVAEEISNLINNGIDINKIYIAGYSNEYYFTIKKIFNLYNIPIYLKNNTKLSDTSIFKYFINNISNNIEMTLYKVRKKFNTDNNISNSNIYNNLFNLINTYYWTNDYVSIKDLIKEEAKNIYISNSHYNKEIVTTNIIDNIFYDDEYVFLIGFNNGIIPKIYKDEDYINDSIKNELMETSIEKNKINKDNYINSIKSIKNLFISYKLLTIDNIYTPSLLIDNININKNIFKLNYSNYSDNYNKLLLTNYIDDLIKFNIKNEDLSLLNNNYKINYKTYNNKYTGINKDKLSKYIKNKGFSYSSISTYYKCPFKFYLTYFLKLDKYKATIDTFIGNLFHKVLEVCLNDTSKDIDIVYDEYILNHKNDLVYDEKCEYYVEKVREEIHFIVDNIRSQYKYMNEFHDEWHEEYIEFNTNDLDLNVTMPVIIKGIVDKCLVIGNDVVIIDYKTGTTDIIDKRLFEYGIAIQLPIYLYLLKNKNKNYNIAGMYLQHILSGLIYRKDNKNKTVEEVRFNRLKLDGITLDNINSISKFDSSYEKSEIIQGLSISKKSNDWSHKNRMITDDDGNKLYDTIKSILENAINNIIDGNFNIRPIEIKNVVDGCNYCKYKDICYRKKYDKNIVILKKDEGDEEDE